MHLERVTAIIEIVGHLGEATVADICNNSDLPKPTVYRLVQDIVGVGLLEPVARGRFAIGARLKRIAHSDQSDASLIEVSAPILKRSASEFGAAFFLSRLRGTSVEIIHVETPNTGVSYLHPGLGKRPLHACSCSKAVAAFNPNLVKIDEMEGKLRSYTEATLTTIADLQAEFDVIRQRGFAECVEEIERGMCSVAAPLSQHGEGAAMSLGAAGSARVLTPTYRKKLGSEVVAIADEVAASLGWNRAAIPDDQKFG